jgi:ATPase family AAA domain-containing protein 3A/B
MSNFDADALERAAKAARELEQSKNVKAIIEMSKREQELKKATEERKAAEANATRAQFGVEQEKVRWEEQRKTIEYNKRQQKASMPVPDAPFPRMTCTCA